MKRLGRVLADVSAQVAAILLGPRLRLRLNRVLKAGPECSLPAMRLGAGRHEIQQAQADQLFMDWNRARRGCCLKALVRALVREVEEPDPVLRLAHVAHFELGDLGTPSTAEQRDQRKPECCLATAP